MGLSSIAPDSGVNMSIGSEALELNQDEHQILDVENV